jgi:hypothetical protein
MTVRGRRSRPVWPVKSVVASPIPTLASPRSQLKWTTLNRRASPLAANRSSTAPSAVWPLHRHSLVLHLLPVCSSSPGPFSQQRSFVPPQHRCRLPTTHPPQTVTHSAEALLIPLDPYLRLHFAPHLYRFHRIRVVSATQSPTASLHTNQTPLSTQSVYVKTRLIHLPYKTKPHSDYSTSTLEAALAGDASLAVVIA